MKTIFIVDDNATNLVAARNVLDETYKTYSMPSAEKMFQLLEKITPDLILLDIEMPEMGGFEAIKILKSKPETKDIPVVFLTASHVSEDRLEGLTLGAVDYISKPFVPALLLQRINRNLG
ncbi:MAG: response regulator [Treponema sp.]|nr:response regulator [Treponema sp.]